MRRDAMPEAANDDDGVPLQRSPASRSQARTAEQREQIVREALPPRPRQPRPVVILGAGGIVRAAHLPAYVQAGLPVVGLADQVHGRAAQLAAEFPSASGESTAPRTFDSVEEAIRLAPPDVVFDVAVPAAQLTAVLPLLPAGAVVLLQKPMGETLAEAAAIRQICRDRNLVAAVNFQLRYAPNHLGAQALARAGVLGRLHDLEVRISAYTPWELWSFLATAPRLEILYHSVHYLDLVRSWLGNPRTVYAKTVRNPLAPNLAATKTTMLLDFGDWQRVTITTNHGFQFDPATQESYVQWEGTDGALRMGMGVNLDYPRGRPDTLAFADRHASDRSWQPLPMRGNWFPDAFAGSMGALQAFAEGSRPDLPISVELAYETMALVEAAYRSSERGGEPLPLP